ncbi:hypothetical protein QO200_06300, partial [Flavobacterium sp. Arc3]|uniref:hypothetical protein n=1 Tax=Flavobacterium sp. Arc3 TaxID=3046686 RepID=UPI00352C30F8
GGQFTPELVVNLHWNWVVNLTGFSNSEISISCCFIEKGEDLSFEKFDRFYDKKRYPLRYPSKISRFPF